MNRKIIGLILGITTVLFVAAVTMSAIAADNPQEVKIENETFHIPDGYKEANSSEMGGTIAKVFKNDKNDIIVINVGHLEGNVVSISPSNGEVEKEISGIKGNYNETGHMFTYLHDGKLISISGPDEKVIAEIIK